MMTSMDPKNTCQNFRRILADAMENSPLHQAELRAHEEHCPECAAFRANMARMDRLGHFAGKSAPTPSAAARERLQASWQCIAVRRTWRDYLKYWYNYEFEPRIMRPLLPHAAMIVGFMFFSLSLIELQNTTGLLTRSSAAIERRIAHVAPAEGLTKIIENIGEIPVSKTGTTLG